MAKVMRFAALLGIGAKKPKGKGPDDEECKPKDGETDEEFASRMKKADWDDGDARKQGAEESDKDYATRMREPAEEDKEAAAEEEDNDEKEREKEKAAAFANGFKAGGKRWEDVLASEEAAGRVVTACTLLSETSLTAGQIRTSLSAIPQERASSGLQRRMAEAAPKTPTPDTGGAEQAKPGDPKTIAAAVVAAADKARGVTKAA